MSSRMFFAAVRMFLADGNERALSAVYTHILSTIVLPRAKRETKDKELLDGFISASKNNSPESVKYGKDAWNLIRRYIQQRNFGTDTAEDFAQQAIKDILQHPNTVDTFKNKFKIETGIKGFGGLIWTVTRFRLENEFRDLQRHQKELFKTDVGFKDEEGHIVNPLDNMASPPLKTEEEAEEEQEEDEIAYGNLKDAMTRHLQSKFPSGMAKIVLDKWMKALEQHSDGRIVVKHDILDPIIKEHGLAPSADAGLKYHLKNIKIEVVKWFEKQGIQINRETKEKLNLASCPSIESRIAMDEFKNKVGRWLLR